MNTKTLPITELQHGRQYPIYPQDVGDRIFCTSLKFTGETEAEAARRANREFQDYYSLNGDFILKYLTSTQTGLPFSAAPRKTSPAAFLLDGFSLGRLTTRRTASNSVAEIDASYNTH
jgi:hypothetical protein